MKLSATSVFVPGSYPEHTYVERSDAKLTHRLRDALTESGKFISVTGPSKSGKTVLVENIVGKENLIVITGAGITQASDVWNRILDWMEIPSTVSKSAKSASATTVALGGAASGSIPLIAKAEVNGKVEQKNERATDNVEVRGRRGLKDVEREIAKSGYVVLLDDFHYIPTHIQAEVMKDIKEAARLGIQICIASVMNRADDAIRANQEMQGRFTAIDLNYWSVDELMQIADKGFDALNAVLPVEYSKYLANEAAGSPQLMQTLCLEACRTLSHRDRTVCKTTLAATLEQKKEVFGDAAATMDFSSLVDVLDCGPKERGKERKVYKFANGRTGDVYRSILNSIASDPPMLSFSYDELLSRVGKICDGEHPSGGSIHGSCEHMVKLAQQRFPNERQIDWNKEREVLDITEPYLLFYLRWSQRLSQPNV